MDTKTAVPGASGSHAEGRSSPGALLVASGIEKSYRRGIWPVRRGRRVLSGVSLALYPGEIVGLAG